MQGEVVETPILLGIGTRSQRFDDPREGLDAVQLMRRALALAARDVGERGDEILEHVDLVLVPQGTWQLADPGRLVLDGRTSSARSVVAELGVLQQSIVTRAIQELQAGSSKVALILGGEAKYRALRAQILGIDLPPVQETVEGGSVERMVPSKEVITDLEIQRDLAVPTHQYALIESALRSRAGRTLRDQSQSVAELVAALSDAAATNPDAWTPRATTVEDVMEAPRVAAPYTKPCCSQWNVDQAVALILTTESYARSLGCDPERFIYPFAAAESNLMVPVTEREELWSSPAARFVGEEIAARCGGTVHDIDLLELYSCFPAAVQVQLDELGIARGSRSLSVTGGMHFGGGPLNSFTFQALATMAGLMRDRGGATGMVTCISGMFTKFAAGLWSTKRPESSFESVDVTTRADGATPRVEVNGEYRGEVRVEVYTVTGEQQPAAIVLGRNPQGQRTVSSTRDSDLCSRFDRHDLVGASIMVDGAALVPLT
jgi:acetyl-CoA C-acetyltransferase